MLKSGSVYIEPLDQTTKLVRWFGSPIYKANEPTKRTN